MNRTIDKIFLMLLVMMSSFQSIAAKQPKTDHPLVSPYQGSSIYSKNVMQYEEYRVFKGWDSTAKKYNTQMIEGKVTRILYKNPPERSVLELYRNYQSALNQKNVDVLYECNQANMECVDGYVGAHLRQQFGIHAIGNRSGRYMFAKVEQENHTAYLALAVGEQSTDVHVIELTKMETGMAAVNVAALAAGIDSRGYVVVEGIYFDTDKTQLKKESEPALSAVAKLLQERPQLELYVVGHTDMQGALAHNMNLSTGRAKTVVSALVEKYGISASRLVGHGVGPLAPVAANHQDNGRAKNRRVVLVQRNIAQ